MPVDIPPPQKKKYGDHFTIAFPSIL